MRHHLERTTVIAAPLDEVFRFFSDPANLARITPPSMRFRIEEAPSRALQEGDRIRYSIRALGLPMRWTTLITLWQPNECFADLQERGPYKFWLHTHSFAAKNGATEMRDHVEYELPLGVFGELIAGGAVHRQIREIFDYRQRVITSLFA